MSSCADELESTYAAHLDTVVRRTSRALETAGFSSLLVHSGRAPLIFADDQYYPFRVNAAFKLWAPLTDVPDCFVYFEPGRKPRMLFHHPRDYWHKPADLPDAFWTRHFELHAVSDRETDVTSYCDWSAVPPASKSRIRWPVVPVDRLERSLANLDRLVTGAA